MGYLATYHILCPLPASPEYELSLHIYYIEQEDPIFILTMRTQAVNQGEIRQENRAMMCIRL